jgi:hypothetical protein
MRKSRFAAPQTPSSSSGPLNYGKSSQKARDYFDDDEEEGNSITPLNTTSVNQTDEEEFDPLDAFM